MEEQIPGMVTFFTGPDPPICILTMDPDPTHLTKIVNTNNL